VPCRSLNRKYSSSGLTSKLSKPMSRARFRARRSTWRGSPSYGVRSGVRMSQNIRPTPCSSGRHGRIANVDGSGIAIMSASSTGLKPVIEEPSKPIPFSSASSSSAALIANDLSWPRTSVNQSRMKRRLRSATSARTSSAVLGWSLMGSEPYTDRRPVSTDIATAPRSRGRVMRGALSGR